jgi:hypothetical protein
MSIFPGNSALVKRCENCTKGRKSHRYWPWEGKCHLHVRWNEDVWEVSFVDTKKRLDIWVKENVRNENILFFDCEWSQHDNGIGLIQLATGVSMCKVLIVDCTKVDRSFIIDIFKAYRMVGWATSNDVAHIEHDKKKRLDISEKVTDLQMIVSKQEMYDKLNQEDREKAALYKPLDKNGDIQVDKRINDYKISRNVWSLDDMAKCFLGYQVKVQLKNHKGWSDKKWKFKDKDIHYAANDVIALAYIYDKLNYIYENITF